jgi:hypothetical protein
MVKRNEPASLSACSRFDDAEESDGALRSLMYWTVTPDSPSDSISTLTDQASGINGVLLQAPLFASDELRNGQSGIEHQSGAQGDGATNHPPQRAPTPTSEEYWKSEVGQVYAAWYP